MNRTSLAIAIAWSVIPLASALSQEEATVEQVNEAFAKRADALEREHVMALFALAERTNPEESARAYRQGLELAIARDLYREAEPAAEKLIDSAAAKADPRLIPLATLVNIVAEADRGDFEQSRKSLEALLSKDPARRPIDPKTALALGEAYFQRLAAAGRYDIARRECQLVVQRAADEGVREHFANRLAQLDLLGKPAPGIEGLDVDGKPVKLSDFKGKHVLIDFWATWCPPCGPAMEHYGEMLHDYADRGFTILGVNLDAAADGVTDSASVVPDVREFLLIHNAAWPNLIAGATGPSEAYRISEIPATFLVAPDGKIEHVDLNPKRLAEILSKLPAK
jgi:thiol-disulfide isomerase/thioredoxin